jgi:hypothetical protein
MSLCTATFMIETISIVNGVFWGRKKGAKGNNYIKWSSSTLVDFLRVYDFEK